MSDLVCAAELPPPLRGTDADPFTAHSITARLPDILQEILVHNASIDDGSVAQLRALGDEIRGNAVVGSGMGTWLSAPWFVIENEFYVRIRSIMNAAGVADPFGTQKRLSLRGARKGFLDTVLPLYRPSLVADAAERRQLLSDVILRSLWGNRGDLSLSSGKVQDVDHSHADANLLCDDTLAVVDLLHRHNGNVHVTIILDNCGLELLSDLVLAATLLHQRAAASVRLVAKTAPVFVSDAMPKDVEEHVHFLEQLAADAASSGDADAARQLTSLAAAVRPPSVECSAHPFFVTGAAMWDAPADVRSLLCSTVPVTSTAASAPAHAVAGDARVPPTPTLLVFKGDGASLLARGGRRRVLVCSAAARVPDAHERRPLLRVLSTRAANYRRLLGDRHWPHDTPFASVVAHSRLPAAVLALRTCKAGLICGITAAAEAGARERHPSNWLVSGTYGVVQLASPPAAAAVATA